MQPLPVFQPRSSAFQIIKSDPDVRVVLAGARGEQVHPMPDGQLVHHYNVMPNQEHQLLLQKGEVRVHHETFRLEPGQQRELHIPHLNFAESTVTLKPKEGRFPVDVTRLQLSPDGSVVAVDRLDGPIIIFNARTGKERFTITRPKTDSPAFGFMPDKPILAYLEPDIKRPGEHLVRFVSTVDGLELFWMINQDSNRLSNARALAFSPDGKQLAISCANNFGTENEFYSDIYRYELEDGEKPRFKSIPKLGPQDGTIETMRFAADGKSVFATAGSKAVYEWKWLTGSEYHRKLAGNPIRIAFRVDQVALGGGRTAFAGWGEAAKSCYVTFWAQSPEFLADAKTLGKTPFGSVALSSNGNWLAAGTQGGLPSVPWEDRAVIRLIDTKSHNLKAQMMGHTDGVLDLAFTSDDKKLVSVSKDGTLRHWRLP
jgi:WD40 repeat protein